MIDIGENPCLKCVVRATCNSDCGELNKYIRKVYMYHRHGPSVYVDWMGIYEVRPVILSQSKENEKYVTKLLKNIKYGGVDELA